MSRDEREWELVRKENRETMDMTLSGVVGPPISLDDVLVPKTALEAAEAEVERLRGMLNQEQHAHARSAVLNQELVERAEQAEAQLEQAREALGGLMKAVNGTILNKPLTDADRRLLTAIAAARAALSEPLDKKEAG